MNSSPRRPHVLLLLIGALGITGPWSAAQSPPASAADSAGELRIVDEQGGQVAHCPLEHTDVQINVAGFVAQATVRQRYRNPLDRKIEAIYVFPLPAGAAVDDMVMTIGERRIRAEIQPRAEAQATYEQARNAGHVAALLDQERPNIFTQSVANIEPGATVEIEIRYVETLKYDEGWFELTFPMVVGPRYIPGGGSAPSPLTHGHATPQVPDAGRITPPVTPQGTRAGHDVALRVHLDPGLPIQQLRSELHAVHQTACRCPRGGVVVELQNENEIPNRDFVLRYKLAGSEIGNAFLTHSDERGRFFTLILQPPERIAPEQLTARELIFVLDTSGSMSGFPIEKAKALMNGLIDTMRPADTFNLITFAGDTRVLWDAPRPANPANRAQAQEFLLGQHGGGGTEMMKAIEAALIQRRGAGVSEAALTPAQLADLAADGRSVRVRFAVDALRDVRPDGTALLSVREGLGLRLHGWDLSQAERGGPPRCGTGLEVTIRGTWRTLDGERGLAIDEISYGDTELNPLRVCVFMTDGYVGNDKEIIAAVQRNADTTRVFSFGVGNCVNRFLLDGMAWAGRGEAEYVSLEGDGDATVARFHERVLSPVLTHVTLDWGNLPVRDVYPQQIPDLFAAKPILVHGRLDGPANGSVRLRGRTGQGAFEREVPLSVSDERDGSHPALASLWARAKVADLMNRDLAALQSGSFPAELESQVTQIGVAYRLMTQFTSFVAVEQVRVTSGGRAITVDVPVEMPAGVSHEGVFGGGEPAGRGVALYAAPAAAGVPRAGGVGQNARELKRADATTALRQLGYVGGADADGARDEAGPPPTPEELAAARDRAAQQKLEMVLVGLAERVAQDGAAGNLEADGLKVKEYRVEVVVRLRHDDAAVRAALVEAGFELSAEAGGGVMVGTIDVRKLLELARVDAVTRVQAVR